MMKPLTAALLLVPLALPAWSQGRDVVVRDMGGTGAETVTAEIWVDNWYALWVNGEQVAEDSTAYNTERSFNADVVTFNADLPMTVAFELRDFMENETGLEYIGTNRQQLGDGGAIFQFTDAAGTLLGVSDDGWSCTVVQRAPVDTSCADLDDPEVDTGVCAQEVNDPGEDWVLPDFDDSDWDPATLHTAAAVSPKGGYDGIDWDASAQFIWGDSLKQDNIVYCRATLE